MILTGEDRSTRKKPVPVPLCAPQMSHVIAWDRIPRREWPAATSSAVLLFGSRRLLVLRSYVPVHSVNVLRFWAVIYKRY
jgi:hypothetical protein